MTPPDGTAVWFRPTRRHGDALGPYSPSLRRNWSDGYVRVKWKPHKKTGTVTSVPKRRTIANIARR